MSKQRDFLRDVGEAFQTLTGGTSVFEHGTDPLVPLGRLVLRCRLNHEALCIRHSVFGGESLVTASSVAVQIAFLFDRTIGGFDASPIDLPDQTLAELQRLTLERVRRYGVDVASSPRTVPSEPGRDPKR